MSAHIFNNGDQGAMLERVEWVFDPQYGYTWQYTYIGIELAIRGTAELYELSGFRTHVYHNGNFWTLEASLPTPVQEGGVEIPVDRWTIHTEFAQLDIFSHAAVQVEISNWVDVSPGTRSPGLYKKYIEDAQKEGTALDSIISGFPFANLLYNELIRGAQSYEQKRPTLNRRRTISPTYATPIVIDAVEKFYSTAVLISAFAVPTRIAAQLPSNPALKPDNTQWGWRIRQQTSEFTLALNKNEETTDWVFATWSTLLYDYIS